MAGNQILTEIEAEIKKAKGDVDDFEIEVIDDPVLEAREEAADVADEQESQITAPRFRSAFRSL
jgi:hypothetical protein